MERNNDRISSIQLGMILSVTMIGVGILSLPRALAEEVGPDGWIVLLLGTMLTFIVGILMIRLAKKFPQKTLVEFSNTLLGKYIGTLFSIGFCIYFTLFAAIVLRSCGEVSKEYLLLGTPIEVLMISILLVAAYLARGGIEPIGRMAQIIFPGVTIIATLIILPVIPEIDLTNMLPVLRTPVTQIIKAIPVVFFSFVGIEVVLLFSAFVIDRRNIEKNVCLNIGITSLMYMFILIVTISRFGIEETKHILWPSIELFKTVDLPGAFIENIEVFVISIWFVSVFMTLAVAYFCASLILSRVIKSKEQNYLVLPLLIPIYYVAMFPDNLAQAVDYTNQYSNYMGTFYMVLLPILLLVISLFKRKRGEKNV